MTTSPSVRPKYNARARENQHWNERMETMPREELDALHFRRIRRNLDYAYDHIPFYREMFDDAGIHPGDITSLDDFNTKVPIIDKPQLMELQQGSPDDPFQGRDPVGSLYHTYRFQTSGTTGEPLQEAMSSFTAMKMGESWTYGFWRFGMRPGDRFYFAFPFGTFAGFWSAFWGVKRLGGVIRSGAGLSTEERINDIVAFDPDVVVMTPTYATYMAETAEEMDIDLTETSVRYTVHAGEKGPFISSFRERIETGWGADVFDLYGQSESPFLGPMMDVGADGVHPCEPYFYSVAVDPDTGDVLEENGQRGEHIVTTHIPGAPGLTLRYRTHDIVEVYGDPTDATETDVTWKYFKGSVLDRTDNMVTIRGANVYPRALEEIVTGVEGATPHYEFHVRRESGTDHLLVKLEADPSVHSSDYEDIADRAVTTVKNAVGVRIEVEVLEPGELPRYELKARRFFDHREEA